MALLGFKGLRNMAFVLQSGGNDSEEVKIAFLAALEFGDFRIGLGSPVELR